VHRTVGVQEEDPDGTLVEPAVVVVRRTDRDLVDAVAVEIAEERDGPAEAIPRIERAAETALRLVDALLVPHGADLCGRNSAEDAREEEGLDGERTA
jgi:hypothetical protein